MKYLSFIFLALSFFIFITCSNNSTNPEDNSQSGYKLVEHTIQTQYPSIINIMFQVSDMNDKGIDNLVTEDFEVKEDNKEVSKTESAMQIRKKDVIPYTLKTVLLLDNSASVGDKLNDIKNAANALVDNIAPQQVIAVYQFSENAMLIQDFTDDVSKIKKAINSISLGYATTDLYGSIITCLSRWQDIYTTTQVQQGFLIALTDGSDTQGSHTLNQALSARGNKRIYTIGLGDEIEPDVLQNIGNAGFFSLTDISQLTTKFTEIQAEMAKYANSFYWLNYISPKRGDIDHTLKLYITNNSNSSSNSYITGEFNSRDFGSLLKGIYINLNGINPNGIDELTVADTIAYPLTAMTYLGNNPPEYEWTTSDSTIVRLEINNDKPSDIIAFAAGKSGACEITVNDVANSLTKVISVDCVVEPSVRINSTEEKPEGIDELEILESDTVSITASTYLQTNPPEYSWSSANESVVLVVPELQNSAIASIIVVGDSGQTTTIAIEDVANSLSKTLDVVITKSSIPTDGLVAYYPFNGNANDESGNAYHGTVNGATLTTDRKGNSNSAYSFDGIDDYIQIDNVNVSDLFLNNFSFCVWVNFGNFSSNYPNIFCADEFNFVLSGMGPIYGGQQNHISSYQQNGYSYTSDNRIGRMDSAIPLNVDEWYFLTIVKNNLDFTMYINSEISAQTSSEHNIVMNGSFMAIGADLHSGTPANTTINGIIDDIRIYDKAITKKEVLLLFNETN